MKLQELHDKLLSEGCNRFYIEGIGEPISDDVKCFGMIDQQWAVFYMERGRKSDPIYQSPSLDEAIAFYYNRIKQIEHWHLIAFTRSIEVMDAYKNKLERAGIRVIQNDIPDYTQTGDRVYRIFVTNSDIFKAQKLFDELPHRDEDLRRNK